MGTLGSILKTVEFSDSMLIGGLKADELEILYDSFRILNEPTGYRLLRLIFFRSCEVSISFPVSLDSIEIFRRC